MEFSTWPSRPVSPICRRLWGLVAFGQAANGLFDGSTNEPGGSDCGLTDLSAAGAWRLPKVRELQILVHYELSQPAVPNTAGTGKWSAGDPFSGVQSASYWSSTTLAGSTGDAWNVGMGFGDFSSDNKIDPRRVWPVRGGQ